jgi:hypothetical protein
VSLRPAAGAEAVVFMVAAEVEATAAEHTWAVEAVARISAEAVAVRISVVGAVISADALHRCRGLQAADRSTCRAAAGNRSASYPHQALAEARGQILETSRGRAAAQVRPTSAILLIDQAERDQTLEVRPVAINWIIFLILEVAAEVECRDLPCDRARQLLAAPSLAERRDNSSMIARVDLVPATWPMLPAPALVVAANSFVPAITRVRRDQVKAGAANSSGPVAVATDLAAVAIDPAVAVIVPVVEATVHFGRATTRGPVRVAAVNSGSLATGPDDPATTIARSAQAITRDRHVQAKAAAASNGSRAIGRIIGQIAFRIATSGTTGGTIIATTSTAIGTITGITTTGTIGTTIGGGATTGTAPTQTTSIILATRHGRR